MALPNSVGYSAWQPWELEKSTAIYQMVQIGNFYKYLIFFPDMHVFPDMHDTFFTHLYILFPQLFSCHLTNILKSKPLFNPPQSTGHCPFACFGKNNL